MFTWATVVSGVLGVLKGFLKLFEIDLYKQAGKDQRDAETLANVSKGREARELARTDAAHAKLLLKELGLGSREGSDDRQLLFELQSRMSATNGSPEYGAGHIAELRNVQGALYKYSSASLGKLSTCQYELQLIGLELTLETDATVVCGTRSMEDQEKAFNSGASKVPPGQSLHNRFPSDAFDIVPAEAPRLWAKKKDLPSAEYYAFAERVFAIADRYNIALRWGGDWDGDRDYSDQTFNDFGHFERVL